MSRVDGLTSKPAYAFRYNKAKKQITVYKGNIFYDEKHAPGTKRPSSYFVCEGEKLTKYVFHCNEGEVDHYKVYLLDNGQDSIELGKAVAKSFKDFYTKQLNELLDKEAEVRRDFYAMLAADFVEVKE